VRIKRSYSAESNLNRPSISQDPSASTVCLTLSEGSIPPPCDKKLIREYLEGMENVKKDFSFDLSKNEVTVYCPALERGQAAYPLRALKRYIQAGERLASINIAGLIMKGVLLAAIAVSSLIVTLLFIFIPSLMVSLPAVVVPLLVMAILVSSILFCCISLPGYAEIKAAKQTFGLCEANLQTMLRKIHHILYFAPHPGNALDSSLIGLEGDLNPNNLFCDSAFLSNAHPSTSGMRLFSSVEEAGKTSPRNDNVLVQAGLNISLSKS
jgi:hypothetical protein